MPIVLVHGVPETSAIWNPLLGELAALGHTDVITLSPPAFGAPRPDGFGATMSEYRDWLIQELSAFDTPVDLVGHDFGGGHTMGVAMTRPDLLRSWVTDTIGPFEPDYTWHPQAQIWLRPDEGEQNINETFGGSTAERAERMTTWGIPQPTAGLVAAGQGPEMGRAILSLYRSAPESVLTKLGRDLPNAAARPGLVLIAMEDHAVGTAEARHRAAVRAGAQTQELDGLGHWWMLQDPALGARVLTQFWEATSREPVSAR